MKIFVWLLLLGLCFNAAYAYEPQTEESVSEREAPHRSIEEDDKSSQPKFSILVRSTMDLLGPAEELSENSQSGDVRSINQ